VSSVNSEEIADRRDDIATSEKKPGQEELVGTIELARRDERADRSRQSHDDENGAEAAAFEKSLRHARAVDRDLWR
jgi:hypothetical protein